MEGLNQIPEFKKKEINPEYLDNLHEDKEFKYFKFLYTAMQDFGLHLTLDQIIDLMEYGEKAEDYLKEIIAILSGKDVRRWMTSREIMDFKNEFSPKTKAETLLFNVYINICNEIVWIDEVLKMEDVNSINGDE